MRSLKEGLYIHNRLYKYIVLLKYSFGNVLKKWGNLRFYNLLGVTLNI